jgi:hemin uptake protein HemP
MMQRSDQSPPGKPANAVPQGTRTVTTAELFGGGDEIVLLHNGVPYRLRITRQDKLILTK